MPLLSHTVLLMISPCLTQSGLLAPSLKHIAPHASSFSHRLLPIIFHPRFNSQQQPLPVFSFPYTGLHKPLPFLSLQVSSFNSLPTNFCLFTTRLLFSERPLMLPKILHLFCCIFTMNCTKLYRTRNNQPYTFPSCGTFLGEFYLFFCLCNMPSFNCCTKIKLYI